MVSAELRAVNIDRIVKLSRLLLISEHDCDVTPADSALTPLFASLRLDAHLVTHAFERGAHPVAVQPTHTSRERTRVNDDESEYCSDIWFALSYRHWTTPRDARYIESFARWSRPLSDRLRKWLADICDKLVEAA
jgi:hypothetical protein